MASSHVGNHNNTSQQEIPRGASASFPGLEPSSLSMKYKSFENYHQFYLSHFQGHPVSVGHFQASIEIQKLRHKGGSQ